MMEAFLRKKSTGQFIESPSGRSLRDRFELSPSGLKPSLRNSFTYVTKVNMNQTPPPLSLGPVSTNTPVFNCIVHVLRDSSGNVIARVANLPGIVCTASTERDVLTKIVKEFKQVVRELSEIGSEIPWIDPPSTKGPEEQTRFIPVHL